jgi:hypothetical protein
MIVSVGVFALTALCAANRFFSIHPALFVLGDKPAPPADFAHHAAVGNCFPEAPEEFLLRLTVS